MTDPIDRTVDVVVTEDIWGSPFDELAEHRSVLRCPTAWQDRRKLVDVASRARALVVRNRTTVDVDVLTTSRGLQIVARAGVGLDNIDLAAADMAGIVVTAPLGVNATSVAEHTLGLALALSRRTVELAADCRAGGWHRIPGRELSGGTWGLLGAGATARACGRLAHGLGMRVLAYDPYIDPQHPGLVAAGVELTTLTRVATLSDVLSCHLPATQETADLVNAGLLARLRPTAMLINVGRGEVVDEEALADALESQALAGAALDVRRQEPSVPGRLERLGNVILTPHIAGITDQSQQRILEVLAADIDSVLDGKPAVSAVGQTKRARP